MGARGLGPDIIEYLTAKGHTFHHRAEKKLRDMPSPGWSVLLKKWAANAPIVESIFGLTAYEVDSLYTKHLRASRLIPLGTPPAGSRTGGKGRGSNEANYNQTGWDNINLQSIAMTGKPDPAYLALLQELKTKPFSDLFDTVYTRYKKGTALEDYMASPPTVGGAAPVTPSPAKEEEEEEEEEKIVILPSVIEDFADKLSLKDVTLFLEEGDDVPEIEISDRKISSKAYNLASNGAFEVTGGKIVIPMKKLKADQVVDWMWPALSTIGTELTEWEEMLSKGAGEIVEVMDEDGYPYETLDPPEVVFIVDIDDKTVSIGINGKVVPATIDEEGTPYTFTKAEIIVEDPATSDKIQEVLLDGSPMDFGKKEGVKFEYGLPIQGVKGLPENCYESSYDEGEGKAGEDATTLSGQAKGHFFEKGGRAVWFGEVKNIEYNIEGLGENNLQPLALDFDTILDLEKEGVYFVLVYETPLDGSNLFPGFDINSTIETNQEAIFFPNDVRNLRPINEDGLVMLQKLKARRAGEGIESIETASSNLQGSLDVILGDTTYDAEVYTQIQITFEGGEQLLVPDGDERFKALDNSDSEIKGVISVDETTEKPQMMVLKGDGQKIYESLEKGRRADRLSKRFNRMDKDQKINTQTAMIQQGDSYYIIMGVGTQTVLVEMDMSRED